MLFKKLSHQHAFLRTIIRIIYGTLGMPGKIKHLKLVQNSLNMSSRKAYKPSSGNQEHSEFIEYLFRRYKGPLARYLKGLRCNHEETEEILQQTYIRIIGASDLDQLEVKARSYLYKIALNLLRDCIRRGAAREEKNHVPIDDFTIKSESANPEQITAWNKNLSVIKQTLLSLQPRPRKIFLLHFFEHYSLKDIADILGVHRKTVERDLTLAVTLCRDALGDKK